MSKLFLSASFSEVAGLLPDFLDRDLKEQTVTFIQTAGNVETLTFYLDQDRQALRDLGLEIEELDVSQADQEEIKTKISQNDYIFVAGGNTFYLLQEMQRSGADKIIIEAIDQGKPYIGSSAGSVLMAPNIEYVHLMDSPDKAPLLSNYRGLGQISFSPLPHYRCFPFTRACRITYKEYHNQLDLITLTNKQVAIVDDLRSEVWEAS